MNTYSIVNNDTGTEIVMQLAPSDVDESRWLWSLLGWSVFEWKQ